MTAAIYAARANKKITIVDKDGYGGQIAKSPRVENYPGFAAISGADLTEKMFEQMSSYEDNINYILDEVKLIKYRHGVFIASLSDGSTVCAKSLINATGTKPRELPFETKNLHYCVTCDGPFYKGKDVIVAGSGNTGATFALDLANYCKHVYICDITPDLMCEKTLVDRIKATKSIEFLPRCSIKAVKNNENGELESVEMSTCGTLNVSAIFGAAGMLPQTSVLNGMLEGAGKYISVDSNCKTSFPGLFAAGDCIVKTVRQVSTAVNDGTIAAISAINFLNSLKM